MSSYLPNPFAEAYVTHTVSDDHFVRFFSPVLVQSAVPILQPGNVVLKGTLGSGKSMLLRLLDPEIRIAYFQIDPREENADTRYPVARELRDFVSTRVDLNKSGLLDIANTLSDSPTSEELANLTKSFADFFNWWLLRGLLLCVQKICSNPEPFDGLVDADQRDGFAVALAREDCWLGGMPQVRDWNGLQDAVKNRIVAYRSWANGNRDLPDAIRSTRTMIGEPLARASAQLKAAGVVRPTTHVFATIDQIEALWMRREGRRELGERLRRELHEVLGKRDERVSYRIGARRYDWAKDGSLAMRDGRELEEGRDYVILDIDALLRRGENAKGWTFLRLAKDVFRRRVSTTLANADPNPQNLHDSAAFFGPSPSPQDVVAEVIRKPDFNRLIKLDDSWPNPWLKCIRKCYELGVKDIPSPPPPDYPADPLNALLLTAWGLQTGGKGKKPANTNRQRLAPPQSADDPPWNDAKKYWRKERYPQAVLQLVSRHQQRMQWWGEAKVLSLCGSNIFRFITICRATWDYWQRLSGHRSSTKPGKSLVPKDIQSSAIFEASRKVYEALMRQPGQPAGDARSRFLDQIASWLRGRLLDDTAMSNPGQNGFSLRLSDLAIHPELRQLIEECVGWGDLYEMDHTSKIKTERSSEPRKKYYINPALAPFYDLPEAHTKEPVYTNSDTILLLAIAAGAIQATPKEFASRQAEENPNQLSLFPET